MLENGKYGKLVPMEDVDALSKALIEELNGPKMAPHRESFARFQLEDATKSYLKTLLDQPS